MDGFELRLPKTMPYAQVVAEVASFLNLTDPAGIRLTPYIVQKVLPGESSMKESSFDSLETMILHSGRCARILYYEFLAASIQDHEPHNQLKRINSLW